MFNITFLGTSAMVPTKERNHSSVYVEHNGTGILLDCGEGTQRQLRIAGISPAKISIICLTHWHGDHAFGIPGLLQTMSASNVIHEVTIIGPEGTDKNIKALLSVYPGMIHYPLRIIEAEQEVIGYPKFDIIAMRVEHSVPTLGFSIKEHDTRRMRQEKLKKEGIPDGPWLGLLQKGKKAEYNNIMLEPGNYTVVIEGKKISYIMDSAYCNNSYELAKDSDLLICEATFSDEHDEKSTDYGHMTGRQAGMLAMKANTKKLVLTHFSQRYKNINPLLEQAKEAFPETIAAEDFMKIKIK
ncbi:MAG: ribonuclease Z [Candidatus Woesearchaeota archaeon]